MKVLIADDYVPFAGVLATMTQRLRPQAAVRTAHTIADALDALLQDGPADTILLDLGLPDAVGFSGLHRMIAAAPSASIGIVSSDDTPKTVRGAFAEGARAYLPKNRPADEFEAGQRRFLDTGFFAPADCLSDEPGRSTLPERAEPTATKPD